MTGRARRGHKFCIALLLTLASWGAFEPGAALGQDHPPSTRLRNQSAGKGYVPTFTFDVASIRQSKPGAPFSQRRVNPLHSSRYLVNDFWLAQVIGDAYGVDYRSQIFGGPDWIRATPFNIQAVSGSDIDNQLAKLSDADAELEKQHMLQILLAQRFNLKTHEEIRELPVVVLCIAKNGPKIQAAESSPSSTVGIVSRREAQGIEIIGHEAQISQLVKLLPFYFGKNITDQTGLTENYDFTLQFHGTLSRVDADNATLWPPIELAMRDQLGLEVKTTKGPVKVVVVDHIEKPSEN